MKILHRFRHTAISTPNAFSAIYERNRRPVFRYIYSVFGGPWDDAEDLTAETFMRAWKARHTFDRDLDSAIGWLIGIAKRLIIDDYRRKEVRKTYNLPRNLKAETTTEEEILIIQQKQQLLDLLKELSSDQREIIVLRYVLGWKVNQIAVHMGLSENHVSVIIHRTIADLREKWIF